VKICISYSSFADLPLPSAGPAETIFPSSWQWCMSRRIGICFSGCLRKESRRRWLFDSIRSKKPNRPQSLRCATTFPIWISGDLTQKSEIFINACQKASFWWFRPLKKLVLVWESRSVDSRPHGRLALLRADHAEYLRRRENQFRENHFLCTRGNLDPRDPGWKLDA
jgi:hypothetical protein